MCGFRKEWKDKNVFLEIIHDTRNHEKGKFPLLDVLLVDRVFANDPGDLGSVLVASYQRL